MKEQPNHVGKYLLIIFYVFVGLITCVEQVDFTNEFSIALPLSSLGLLVSIFLGARCGLFFGLVAFPLTFDFVYFALIVPRMPQFLIELNMNTLLFSGIYTIFLLVLYFKNWNYLAWLTFLVGIIHTENKLPGQLYAAINYKESGIEQPTLVRNSLAKIQKSEKSPIYLICLDGYPDLATTNFGYLSRADSLLRAFHFNAQKNQAKAFQTPISLRFLLTGKLFPQVFTNFNSSSLKKELTESLQGKVPSGYEIYLGSILLDYNLAQPYFPVTAPIRPNRLMLKPFKCFFREENYIGSSASLEKYHDLIISQIDGKPQKLKLIHLITFHGVSTPKRDFFNDIPMADELLLRILVRLQAKAPHAKVIIFSDHGERFTKGFDPRAAIFYSNF